MCLDFGYLLLGVQPCSVTAEVNYPPQKVEIAPASQNKLVGKEATVTCLGKHDFCV